MVFHILPTALEISLVCGILVRRPEQNGMFNADNDRPTNMAGNSPSSLA